MGRQGRETNGQQRIYEPAAERETKPTSTKTTMTETEGLVPGHLWHWSMGAVVK